ncbi:hypothetical protein CFOL_v3_17847 [Cephalotus follicularis]|uniref:Chromo domain-containing protein n=1 Tax=Cephalotus follicularis TaxID=3775 RepID=A0A1Q3C277_CEPFO|nr:hypothetical protein CFOL_v3_17847 [Cephalotus follicularis]
MANPSHVLRVEPMQVREDLSYDEQPVEILDYKEQILRTKRISLVKVMWRNHGVDEATCELEETMCNTPFLCLYVYLCMLCPLFYVMVFGPFDFMLIILYYCLLGAKRRRLHQKRRRFAIVKHVDAHSLDIDAFGF